MTQLLFEVGADECQGLLRRRDRDPLLATLVGHLDPSSLIKAMESATRAFLDELNRGDPALAGRLTPRLSALVRASREAVTVADIEMQVAPNRNV